ncbi:hypothetical protein AAG906_032854 [Vitis piasezkii]
MMDLDMARREDEPPKPTNESTENCLSLISIKRSIAEHLLGGIPESNNAKEFLVVVANRYQTFDNAEVGHFMDELMNMRNDDMKGFREYILKMVHLQTRLKALDIPIPDKFIGVNDLITKCVAEEEKLKREKNESAHLVALGKPNNQKRVEKARNPNFHSHKKSKNFKKSGSEKQKNGNGNAKNIDLKCYHYNKKVNVPLDSWWLDSGATVYVATSLYGIRNLKKPSEKKLKRKVGSDIRIDVEHIGIVVLELDYVDVIYDSKVIGNCVLSDRLYRLLLLSTCSYNERSSLLWHKHLGHISKERVESLISSGILPRLDSDDLEICVDCVKGKLTKNKKKCATRNQNLLEIVHTDISGPYSSILCGNKYFITFIDDLSRYGYYFRTEVEKQLGKVINIVRSDRGGEYYGKHGDARQRKGPFARYLQDNGIVGQYTMPGSPEQNDVVERHNHTLMEMKMSMMTIKTATYILNRVPSKFVPKTPFELWTGRKPSLNHFKKTDLRTTRCYFIGYPSHSKGYKFYCSTHGTRVVESQVAKFLELDVADSIPSQSDERVEPMDVISLPLPVSDFNLDVGAFDSGIQQGVATINFPTIEINPIVDEIPPMEMRRSQRTRRLALSNDYYVYLGEGEYKARLVAKGNTQREGIDFIETFSLVSTKDSFRLIMALVAHFDLELHQMDVKTTFLNGDLSEEAYMSQPEGFKENGKENMNKFDQCIYMKVNGSKYIFMVLYIDDILLASSDANLLNDTKRILSANFNMKDLGEASFVLGIEIYRDRSRNLLGPSQRAYINRVLKKFNWQTCKAGDVPVVKGDKLSNEQCPKNDLEKDAMKTIPYASAIGSLMYVQVCTRPDIAFIVNVRGRYLSNPRHDHWVAAKKVMRYIQRMKDFMLVYRKVDNLESLIASSTMYAKFVACYGASSQAVWLRNLISELQVVDSIFRPIVIYCEIMQLTVSKHMEIKYLTVKELVKKRDIVIEHIKTESMLVDPLTKGLKPITFKEHVVNMGVIKSFDSLV